MLYDAFFSGGIGGSVVVLYFLVVDVLNGQPLYTPSLMGSVLFEGASAEAVSGVRLQMVAYYSLVHFASFSALGALLAFLVHEVELHSRHPALVVLLSFLIIECAFACSAALFLPGVIEHLGALHIAAANLLTAGSIALFLLGSHRPEAWQRMRQALHLP
jgi:hypothetical protein